MYAVSHARAHCSGYDRSLISPLYRLVKWSRIASNYRVATVSRAVDRRRRQRPIVRRLIGHSVASGGDKFVKSALCGERLGPIQVDRRPTVLCTTQYCYFLLEFLPQSFSLRRFLTLLMCAVFNRNNSLLVSWDRSLAATKGLFPYFRAVFCISPPPPHPTVRAWLVYTCPGYVRLI